MVSMLVGPKGSGKTKRMIKLANEDVEKLNGSVVYIDDDKRHMYDLNHDMRFMTMEDYPIKTKEEFFGFVCGIISNNYDIERIYIDGLLKVVDISAEDMIEYFDKFKNIAQKNDLKFIFALNQEKEALPKALHEYIL
ncbi:MAG: ATP-binding protein [Clostridia bacterium]|nr:ATP-binding protein [Clostridia bacterium]